MYLTRPWSALAKFDWLGIGDSGGDDLEACAGIAGCRYGGRFSHP